LTDTQDTPERNLPLKLLALLFYMVFFLPVWAFVRLTEATRFGRRFHQRDSAWDVPVATPRRAQAQPAKDAQLAARGNRG